MRDKKTETTDGLDLARLADPTEITVGWLEDIGWEVSDDGIAWSDTLNADRQDVCLRIILDSGMATLIIWYSKDDDSIDLPFSIKTRGQLFCLIRGLGGDL